MFQFVYWLRAIAAVMITNSHYADIWPISAMAFGGHFGNCIYFFLSGFCLYNIQESFPRWYAKRIIRIYPALWIVAAVKGGIFAKAGNAIQGIVTFIAGISLEIYLGQALIIARLNRFTFPLNFVVVTGMILIYAYLIHKLAQLIQKPCSRLLKARQKETAQ